MRCYARFVWVVPRKHWATHVHSEGHSVDEMIVQRGLLSTPLIGHSNVEPDLVARGDLVEQCPLAVSQSYDPFSFLITGRTRP